MYEVRSVIVEQREFTKVSHILDDLGLICCTRVRSTGKLRRIKPHGTAKPIPVSIPQRITNFCQATGNLYFGLFSQMEPSGWSCFKSIMGTISESIGSPRKPRANQDPNLTCVWYGGEMLTSLSKSATIHPLKKAQPKARLLGCERSPKRSCRLLVCAGDTNV